MPMTASRTVESMVRAYTAGPMFERWRLKQDEGLWKSEQSLIETHCPNTDALICNVGCGAGRETFAMYRLGYHNTCGIDSSDALLEAARHRCQIEGFNIFFKTASADKLPFEDASVDAITMFENLYGHITPRGSRLAVLSEARRILKPGGVILMTVTSLHASLRYRAWFFIAQLMRRMHNPYDLEPGDKIVSRACWSGDMDRKQAPRTHWFRPGEVPVEAQEVGLIVRQCTTTDAVVSDPTGNSSRLRGCGRLVYVLQRRAD